MNPQANIPPPPRAGAGCLGIGCLSFVGFILFLILAFICGGFWALHKVRKTYSATEPLPLPIVESTPAVAPPVPQTPVVPPAPDATPPPVAAAPPPVLPVEQRWKAFEQAAKHHEKARIELTANDINVLLANGKKTRGKAFVSIANGQAHLQVSIPLNNVVFMSGRYLNGQATIQSAPDGDPYGIVVSDVVVGQQPVPSDFLDRRLWGWSTARGMINDWMQKYDVATFRIEGDRVIGETRG